MRPTAPAARTADTYRPCRGRVVKRSAAHWQASLGGSGGRLVIKRSVRDVLFGFDDPCVATRRAALQHAAPFCSEERRAEASGLGSGGG